MLCLFLMSFLYLCGGVIAKVGDSKPEFAYLVFAVVIAMFCAIVKYPEDPKRRKVAIGAAIVIGIVFFLFGCAVRML